MKKNFIILSALIPGVGHILCNKYLKGIILFTLFAFAINTGLVYNFIFSSQEITFPTQKGFFITGLLIWFFAFADMMYLLFRIENKKRKQKKEEQIMNFFECYLTNKYDKCELILKKLIKSSAGLDPDLLFYKGILYYTQNRLKKSKRYLLQCIHIDSTHKWYYQAHDILNILRTRLKQRIKTKRKRFQTIEEQ